ncbi:hypothetical protein C8J31_102105 [Rhizobium sp. PP-CC-2G-626]|nr:hypothetical protein C8J31_102105 [Rhizobium sp. PP-CC-2G-626]
MSSIWLSDASRLRSFSSSTKGAASVVRIEVTVSDPLELGYLLRELQGIQAKQKLADQAAKPKSAEKRKQLALPAPRLALTYRGDEE